MIELTSGQLAFWEEIQSFAQTEVAPYAVETDQRERLPEWMIERLAEHGYLGIPAPRKYGGLGLDDVCYALAVEELSRACGSTGILVAAHTSLAVFPIQEFGTQDQKDHYLPQLLRGKKLGSFGLTEPGAGSDAAGVRTRAEKVEGGYILHGSKIFITSGSLAQVVIVAATMDPEKGTRGISNFLLDRSTEGFKPGRKEEKLGLRGSDTSELFFEDCFVPDSHLLGQEGDGFKQFMITLDGGRISIGAMAVGLGQAAIDVAWEHLESHPEAMSAAFREQDAQMILAEMETRVAAARHLVLHAARLKSAGRSFTIEAAMAKGFASEVATWAAAEAIQVCGEAAAASEHPAHRIWRDARLCEIGEGTTEVQRIVIFRHRMKQRQASKER